VNMKELSIKKMDEIAVDYESNWIPASGSLAIRNILKKYSDLGDCSYRDLLIELIQIDIEKEWRYRLHSVREQYEKNPACSSSDIKRPPGIEEYEALFRQGQVDTGLRNLIAQQEVNMRWEFGDVPDLDSYGELAAGLKTPEVEVPTIAVSMRDGRQFELDLVGEFVIGRTAEGDPPPPTVALHGPSKKFVCSPASDITTSRTQLLVRCFALGFIVLTNASTNRNVFIKNNGIVAPGAERVLRLQDLIEIPLKYSVVFIRPSALRSGGSWYES